LERVKTDAEKYEIIAPFDGIVRQIDYKVGDNILSDDEKFVYIENPNLLSINISLDQIDIVKVEEGQKANIVFDALPEKTFEGYVDEVNQTPVNTSGVVSYSVTIALNRGEEKIFSGMTAEVEVMLSELKDVLLIPNTAIHSQGERSSVLLKADDGAPRRTMIETGETDDKSTEVKSGLKEGDIVLEEALSGVSFDSQDMPFNQRSNFGGGGLPPGTGSVMRTIR
jgi:RND family efflux transporter MFP subunit